VHRAIAGIAAGLALLLVTAALGFNVAARVWPERLRIGTEERLSRSLGSPVSIGRLRVRLGFGIEIEAFDLQVWPSPEGPRLRVPYVSARPRLLPLLVGRLRLSRLLLDGARLRVERAADGSWKAPPLPALARRDDRRARPHPEELLRPLIAMEAATRALLAKPLLADTLAIRNGGVVFRDAGTDLEHSVGPVERPVALRAQGIRGQFRHRHLHGDAQLHLQARIFDATGERGSIEWDGHRARDGSIRLGLSATSLQLPVVAPYLRVWHPDLRLAGSLSGTIAFQTPSPGEGRLEVDCVVHDFRTEVPAPLQGAFGPVAVPHARAGGTVAITPQSVRLESAQIDGTELHLEASGIVERPLQPSSLAQLSLEFRNVDLDVARQHLGWFPQEEREDLTTLLEPLTGGRLLRLISRGEATLAGWRELFEGRTLTLPMGFAGEAEVEGLEIRVGKANRLAGLGGHVAWSGDRVDIRGARADLNGRRLPRLDLRLEGVSNLFAARAELEPVAVRPPPLAGLRPLWAVLQRSSKYPSEAAPDPTPTTVHLEIDALTHPVFVWPIEALDAVIVARDRGVHIVANRGRWGGVPIRGDADWLFEPEEALAVRLAAESAEAAPEAAGADTEAATGTAEGTWARGRFSVGAVTGPRWQHARAVGRFEGIGGRVEVGDIRIDLTPSGTLLGSARLDLTAPDAVPVRTRFSVTDGEMGVLSRASGLRSGWVRGNVDLSGALEGPLRPGLSPFAELTGQVTLVATDGVLQRRLSPLMAIALASGALNPFAGRDEIRYARVEADLRFADGWMRAESFSLDGPDVRMLVDGEVDVARPPHEVRGEVALFLFRQLDDTLGKVPLLGLILFGTDEAMMAVHFEVSGPWEHAEAKLIPLRSLATAPGGLVVEGGAKLLALPKLVLKGVQAILEAERGDATEPEAQPPARPAPAPSSTVGGS
jgi:hypothetical protein